MTTIRKMQESDAGEVLRLWDAAGKEADGGGFTPDEARNVLAAIKRYAGHPDLLAYVAEQSGSIVGYVLAYITAPHPAYEGPNRVGEIDEYYIVPAARATDAGAKLMDEIVSAMRSQGVEVIHAHAREDMPQWQTLWHEIGWSKDTIMYSWYAYLHRDAERQAA